MFLKQSLCAIAMCAALAAGAVSTLPAQAASASVTVKPHSVHVNGGILVTGAHLPAGAFVVVIFASPKYGKHAFMRFLGDAKTDRKGRFKLQVQLQKGTHCGKAMIYLQPLRSNTLVGTHVTVTGCKKIKPPPKP